LVLDLHFVLIFLRPETEQFRVAGLKGFYNSRSLHVARSILVGRHMLLHRPSVI